MLLTYDFLQKLAGVIVAVALTIPAVIEAVSLYRKRRDAAIQQREREEAKRAARLECSRLLQIEAAEQCARRKAEHDAAIDGLCDRISMWGIVTRMQMGGDLDAEDMAVLRRYQAEGEEHSFAVKRFSTVCGYQFDEQN